MKTYWIWNVCKGSTWIKCPYYMDDKGKTSGGMGWRWVWFQMTGSDGAGPWESMKKQKLEKEFIEVEVVTLR